MDEALMREVVFPLVGNLFVTLGRQTLLHEIHYAKTFDTGMIDRTAFTKF